MVSGPLRVKMKPLPDYLVLDIETVPIDFSDREILDYLIRKKTDRPYHPFFAKIVAIGVKRREEEPTIWANDDEESILRDFWSYVRDSPSKLYVTFNGMGFDVPFLTIRSMINGVRPSVTLNINKWRMLEENHFDLMVALTEKWGITWVSLEIMAKVMDIDLPADRVQGHQIRDLHNREDWDAIRRHNLQDLELTEKLFRKAFDFF